MAALAGIVAGPAAVRAAEIVQIEAKHKSLLPGGKEVDAIIGDYLLRSDKITLVVGGTPAFRDANVNTQQVQGAVIDLVRRDLPGGNNDLLSAYYPHGHFLDAPGATRAEIVNASGAAVVLRFFRPARKGLGGDPVEAVTEYTLRDGEPYVRIKTMYTNPGSEPAQAAIYDKIRADTLFRVPPAGDADRLLIYDEPWHHAAYGVVRAGGAPLQSYANPARVTYNEKGGNRLDFPDLRKPGSGDVPLSPSLPKPTLIAPGESITVERFLIPGRHSADVQIVAAQILGDVCRSLDLHVADAAGKAVGGATVRAAVDGKIISEGFTDPEARLTLCLPPATPVTLTVEQRGRAKQTHAVAANAATAMLTVGSLAAVAFDIGEERKGSRIHGPVKVVINGVDGTPDPNFGPDALAFQAGNLCFSPNGQFSVALPPGSYEAIIGRGVELSVETRRFTVEYGKTTSISAAVRRVLQTPNWVMVDFHNHTTNSNDSIADPMGRVTGIAASGIEFAPATEHNRITSFAPYIQQLNLSEFIASAPSVEFSGRPGPGNINHQNGFPLRMTEMTQDGGAPRRDKDPKIQIGRLYDYDDGAEKFVQQNHPDIPWLYYDKDRDNTPDGGFGTRRYTHAIELNRDIANLLPSLAPDNKNERRPRSFYWLQMLNQGDRIYAVANSDAHVTAHNNGSIFTYVHVPGSDAPARLDPLIVAREMKMGHMVLSNGPYLSVQVNDSLPGDTVSAKEGLVRLRISVECAPAIDIDRVQVLINGKPDRALNWTREGESKGFETASVRRFTYDGSVPLAQGGTRHVPLAQDAHLIVVVTGAKKGLGALFGKSDIPPTAISNPVFVDSDGNGFTPNKDTLGVPLPTGSAGGDGEG